jgi:hypothetical protein
LIAFNLSLKTCTVLDKWKSALACPIRKTNNSLYIAKFRPIAILPAFAKEFGQILYKRIIDHVKPSQVNNTALFHEDP